MANTEAGIILGLDLGTQSVGWSLVDARTQQLIDAGVRIFPEGVDRDPRGGEKSRNQTRREKRGARRQTMRRRQRRRKLLGILIQHGLLPEDQPERSEALQLNPYPLRSKGLDQRLEPAEFGRVLLHLCQRRGFKSNRKTDRKDTEEKGMLAEISELSSAIESTGCRTLGEYLARIDADSARVRGRHTRRDMYEIEFDALWNAQSEYHSQACSAELRSQIHDCIFHQRKMYWPASVIGYCELEMKEKRCLKASRSAQRFRILQEVNNLSFIDYSTGEQRRLTDQERTTLIDYLSTTKFRTFEQIRKKLKLSEACRFNLERGERGKLLGHVTDATLAEKKHLGKLWWTLSEDIKDRVTRILLEEDDENRALLRLEDCGLTQEQAQLACAANLPDDRLSYSEKAIRKLIPHLERGLMLMGNNATDSAIHAACYLRPDEVVLNAKDLLPSLHEFEKTRAVPNPIVRRALVETRRVVNAILREYDRPVVIRVELARDAKKSAAARERISKDNAQRRKQREQAKTEIESLNAKPTRGLVDRYTLLAEQGGNCVYTGKPITPRMLISGEADVDHILPRWRSLDDSKANKVVCLRSANEQKDDRTPYEWLGESDPDRYAAVLKRFSSLGYSKLEKAKLRNLDLNDFVSGQLSDTAYISRLASQYLTQLGIPVETVRGGITADLRHWWGLNILDPEGRGRKVRDDHRHHAIDATVVALTTRKALLNAAKGKGQSLQPPISNLRDQLCSKLDSMVVSHRVSRKARGQLHEDTLYGTTQKSSPESRITPGSVGVGKSRRHAQGWIEDDKAFVRRKPVASITTAKHLDKVRDATIRSLLENHVKKITGQPELPATFPKGVFEGDHIPRMPSGIPIRKVRMIEQSATIRPLSERRNYHNVKPGNNHHISYFEDKGKWVAKVTTLLDASQDARQGRQPILSSHAQQGFKFSLSIGEALMIDHPKGGEGRVFVVVRQIDQSGRLYYRFHNDARPAGELKPENLYLSPKQLQELAADKVTIDPIGRVRNAGD